MNLQKFFGHDYDFTYHDSVALFNTHHFIYLFFLLLTFVFALKYSNAIKDSGNEQVFKKIMIGWLISLEVIYHIHNYTAGRFSVPLHVCSFALIANIILLTTDSYRVWKFAFFYGVCGGTMALLFPVTLGYTYLNIRYYHFLLNHLTIVFIPIYYYKAYDYRADYKTTLDIFKLSFVLMVFMVLLNNLFWAVGFEEANYWFVGRIPSNVDGLFDHWIVYVFTFASAVFITMNILYYLSNLNNHIRNDEMKNS